MNNQVKKKYDLVWYTKYRKLVLHGDNAVLVRDLIRQVCSELEVDIVQGSVKKDGIHLIVFAPVEIPVPVLMRKIKGKSAYLMLKEKADVLGSPVWAKGYFAWELKQ